MASSPTEQESVAKRKEIIERFVTIFSAEQVPVVMQRLLEGAAEINRILGDNGLKLSISQQGKDFRVEVIADPSAQVSILNIGNVKIAHLIDDLLDPRDKVCKQNPSAAEVGRDF